MKTTTATVPIGELITDAAAPLKDWDFGRLGRPFYVAAGFRGLRKMCFDAPWHQRQWSAPVPENLILPLPPGFIERQNSWLYNGDNCNVSKSTPLFIKDNMRRLGGAGYLANNKWNNHDPLQYSYGVANGWGGWSCEPPPCLHFAGMWDKELHLSQSCQAYDRVHLVYTASVDQCEDDFDVPEWAADAITDYITLRAAEALEREDPQHLSRLIARKENEMKAPNGSWREAQYYYKRMSAGDRYDVAAKTYRYGHAQ